MQILPTRRLQSHRRGGNNGGFPEPPKGEPTRLVSCSHTTCGAETRIRLPERLPDRVVQRVVCASCRQPFTAPTPAAPEAPAPSASTGGSGGIRDRIGELTDRIPRPSMPPGLSRASLPDIPRRRLWAWASVPLAVLGVIVALSLIQGSSPAPQSSADTAQSDAAGEGAKLVSDAGYSLALPTGWKQVNPPDGAVFAAEATDGSADATLWIERAPGLSLKEFESRSLDQLDEIAENPRVVDRVNAPTIEGSIVELRGDTPVADGLTTPYRVTLRGAGPFRHYLATAQQPGAEPTVVADIEIMHNSLRPEVKLAGTDDD